MPWADFKDLGDKKNGFADRWGAQYDAMVDQIIGGRSEDDVVESLGRNYTQRNVTFSCRFGDVTPMKQWTPQGWNAESSFPRKDDKSGWQNPKGINYIVAAMLSFSFYMADVGVYNPDAMNATAPAANSSDEIKRMNNRWLIMWRIFAKHSARSGGHLIQLIPRQDKPGEMMAAERAMAMDFARLSGRAFDDFFQVFHYDMNDSEEELRRKCDAFVQSIARRR